MTSSDSIMTDSSTNNNTDDDYPMLKAVKDYLHQNSLTYQSATPASGNGNTTILSLTLNGHHSSYRTYIDLKRQEDRVTVYVETPVKIPAPARARATEFCMRVNYSLALGCLELDWRDGECRYRFAVDVEGSALSQDMIRTQIMVSAATVDKYFPGLMAVTFAPNHSVEQMVNECQNGTWMSDDEQGATPASSQ